jgi:hypothetical protein
VHRMKDGGFDSGYSRLLYQSTVLQLWRQESGCQRDGSGSGLEEVRGVRRSYEG